MNQTALAPVHDVTADAPEAGIGLCLSGGGYRAMLFHLGSLWRLNQLGMLAELNRVSSVSGGSITAAVLGMNWTQLSISKATPIASDAAFSKFVVDPVRLLASNTIDEGSIIGGIFSPGTVADHVANKYDSLVFEGRTLQDLPNDDEGPRFVINATNLQSGVLMRFSRPYMRDYRVGQVRNPKLPLARAVGASSAFPPILSPAEIDTKKFGLVFEPTDGTEDLNMAPYTSQLVLCDGGVYDNLGLEPVWKRYNTVFVSDGGAHFAPEPAPYHDWARQSLRVLNLIDSQVGSLRTRQIIALFNQNARLGTYWGIRQNAATLQADVHFSCTLARTTELASIATRLQKMDDITQQRLINWGYVITDVSIRAHYRNDAPPMISLPYPGTII